MLVSNPTKLFSYVAFCSSIDCTAVLKVLMRVQLFANPVVVKMSLAMYYTTVDTVTT